MCLVYTVNIPLQYKRVRLYIMTEFLYYSIFAKIFAVSLRIPGFH